MVDFQSGSRDTIRDILLRFGGLGLVLALEQAIRRAPAEEDRVLCQSRMLRMQLSRPASPAQDS